MPRFAAVTDTDGNTITAHSTNPVPAILVTPEKYFENAGADSVIKLREDGILADIAPTLLHLMGIDQPAEMTGKSLIML